MGWTPLNSTHAPKQRSSTSPECGRQKEPVMSDPYSLSRQLLPQLWQALGGDPANLSDVMFNGEGSVRSKFALTDLAAAAYAAAGSALSELVAEVSGEPAPIAVDRRLAIASFELPPRTFQSLADPHAAHPASPWMRHFQTSDGRWLWLQAFFKSPRKRLFDLLGIAEDPEALAAELRRHPAEELEAWVTGAGAIMAVSRTREEWLSHPQGRAVNDEALVDRKATTEDNGPAWRPTPGRPLAGIRVLDLTRVVAGPTATRFLAAAGAEVLRIDAPGSDESTTMVGSSADHMVGKRWAFLDLKSAEGRDNFLALLSEADVLAHSYRPGAIDGMVDPELRAKARPGLVEVAIDAYGWTGPWKTRRGFDTIVQFSTGLADETTAWALEDPEQRTPLFSAGRMVPADRPRHLPVESLDLVTGYLAAATVVRGLTARLRNGQGSLSRLSLARTAHLVRSTPADQDQPQLTYPIDIPYGDRIYQVDRGPARRMPFPLQIAGNPLFWERPGERAGSSAPVWSRPRVP